MMNNGVHVFDHKYAQEHKGVGRRSDIKIHEGNSNDEPLVGMGMAQVKRESGLYRGYAGKESMVKVTEQEFLSTIVDRSGVTVEQVGHKHKHYLFCGNHYASKIKGKYWVVESVYKEILKGEANDE